MKIVIATGIYPPDAGGPATYSRSIGKALLELGDEVEIVCYSNADWQRRLGNDEDDGKLRITRVFRETPLLIRYFKYFISVYKKARVADVVYLQGPVSEGFPGMIAARLTGKPIVMKIVGDYAWEVYMQSDFDRDNKELLDDFVGRRHKGEIRWLERIERWTARSADRIVVPSVYLKGIVKRWKISREKITVIFNSVKSFPHPGISRQELRSYHELEDKRVIFTAVRAVPWKNIEFLIRAFARALIRDEDIVLVIAGDGPLYLAWQRIVKDLVIDEKVKFLGTLNKREMGEWYRAADVFVLPSGYEGFPHVIPEAAYFGLPCLVSDQGGNPETQKNLFNASIKILPYLNEYEWVSALLDTRIRRQELILPKRFYFDEMVERTLNILTEVKNKKNGKR
jgi:glycosyltransferase involved in cell wall biosynthesis